MALKAEGASAGAGGQGRWVARGARRRAGRHPR